MPFAEYIGSYKRTKAIKGLRLGPDSPHQAEEGRREDMRDHHAFLSALMKAQVPRDIISTSKSITASYHRLLASQSHTSIYRGRGFLPSFP